MHKINSKWIKILNVRPDMTLEVNIGRIHFDINHSNILFDPPPRIRTIKTKINQWDLLKIFCTAKEIIQNEKTTNGMGENLCKQCNRQRHNLKNMQTAHTVQQQKTKQIQKKCAEDLNRHFSKEDTRMASRHMKKCLISLIITEMLVKTTMRYNLPLVRMANIKRSTNNKCWRGCGENGTLLHCWWEC